MCYVITMAISWLACIPIRYLHVIVGLLFMVLAGHVVHCRDHGVVHLATISDPSHDVIDRRNTSSQGIGSPPDNKRHPIHIGAFFPTSGFNEYHHIFTDTLSEINARSSTTLTFTNVSLATVNSVHHSLKYVCMAMADFNISSIIAVGTQDLINTLSIITRYSGIPLLGYNTDKISVAIRGERPLYLQLDPSRTVQARVIVNTLQANQWFYASLIIEESYANDGFVETFRRLTSGGQWNVEDTIIVSRRHSTAVIDSALLNLLENKSRILILHCSPQLAQKVFQLAKQQHLTERGYAWFVTEEVIVKSPRILQNYPDGLLGFVLNRKFDAKSIVADATNLVTKATERYVMEHGMTSFRRSCKQFRYPDDEALEKGMLLYRYIKNTTYVGNNVIKFDEDGVLENANYKIVNLVQESKSKKRWRTAGYYTNGTTKLSTIIWPGGGIAGPIVSGDRILRVVTNIVEPFVMEQLATKNKCETAIPCLCVQTKDKLVLDEIFRDFNSGIYNESRPYVVHCCQGYAIKLLERFALDMDFNFQLYITSDRRYGNLQNGTWNGLVQDLTLGMAHMAVAALSITRSRSRVIDFTDPYFYSGFSILVSERKRSPRIYAFMEPFDSWVWISIAISATVVAVALSLLEWNSPFGLNPWGRKRKTNYTLGSGLNMVYAILFQHTIKTKSPKAWPSKWLQNYWAGASIFIYSSYTANLAAFLAGKNSGVIIDGIHDPKLLEPGRSVGLLDGMAVEEYLHQVNRRLLRKATRYNETLPLYYAVELLMNDTIDAYLDDTPILEYARTSMDAKCQLRLVGKGFGEDAYGIGLPKNSWLKKPLSLKIQEYHESGFMDDLSDIYFHRSRCIDEIADGQLQGEASPMNFDQHAGLYMLLVVGIFTCVGLMFLEHALFKWLVPYWRRKPRNSFWRSLSMLFWSQRLYRIITSEELVSPHHSAREMIEDFKNRDFTKLFQKSVRKQEKKNLFKSSNIFKVVEQLQLKARRDKILSQNPSTQTECSVESEQPVVALPGSSRELKSLAITTVQMSSKSQPESADILPPDVEYPTATCRPKELCGTSSGRLPARKAKPSLKEAYASSTFTEAVTYLDPSTPATDTDTPDCAKSDDELLQSSDLDSDSHPATVRRGHLPRAPYKLLTPAAEPNTADNQDMELPQGELPLVERASSSEDNLSSGLYPQSYKAGKTTAGILLPNGIVIRAADSDLFTRDSGLGRKLYLRSDAIHEVTSPNLSETLKTLPTKDNQMKVRLPNDDASEEIIERRTTTHNKLIRVSLERLTKEDLFLMWKASESDLSQKLNQVRKEKAELEEKLMKSRAETGI